MNSNRRRSPTRPHRLTTTLILSVMVLGITTPLVAQRATAGRMTSSFDRDWRFLRGGVPDAERTEFDDTRWRKLDVPHDWSIEGPVDEKNPTGPGGGFMPSGVSWYRRHFALSK